MMQETTTVGPAKAAALEIPAGESLVALLALVGTKRMDIEALRGRMKLTPLAFEKLVGWLQAEYLVDIVSSLEGGGVRERVKLTEKGEAALLSLLERTYELPDLR